MLVALVVAVPDVEHGGVYVLCDFINLVAVVAPARAVADAPER
jgi:hypothetical protein